jgi:leader peptidase (prepilin peptidase)/N-methyltransferase
MSIVLAVVVGLAVGTALNLLLYRIPREQRLLRRPHCVRCGHPLGWEALPLLGFLLQRGRCRHCQRAIPWFFPLVELLTALSFAILVWRHGLSALAALYAFFALILILTLFLDWQHRYIYYIIVLPATTVALLGSWLHPNLNVLNSLIALVIATVFFGLIFVLGQVLFHAEAIGLGDVWLAGTIGAMFGFPGALVALTAGMVLAGLAGGLHMALRKGSGGDYMAYGSYLCMGALLYLCIWAPSGP